MKCKLVNEDFKTDYGASLLRARGVADVSAYLSAGAEYIQEPDALENMEQGVELYLDVVNAKKKILVVVDSDNDGFTSSAIIYQYTKRIAPDIEIDYVLHGGKQHGLEDHIDALENLGSGAYGLVILPDSSSNDLAYHERLKVFGIPCLVLDHHITDLDISSNAVVINNQLSPNYHNKELTGAGVTYQFCRAVDKKLGIFYADDFLDLAAWGIIGDMGSVIELENRAIIRLGLTNVKNKFLLALANKQAYSLTGSSTASEETVIASLNPISVAFYIVPLVNAMIRVGTMDEKRRLFEAFLDADKMVPSGKRGAKGTLDSAGNEAARECTNARSRQNATLDKAVDSIEAKIHKYGLLENRILFVRLEDEDDFPSELNGLVAMKLSQKFKRPTIIARLNNQGYDRGSMRGLNQSELTSFKDFLQGSNLFEYVAGHDNAAGVSIQDSDLRAFHEYANKALEGIDFGENCYDVNFVRSANATDLTQLIQDICRYDGIWGQQNDTPLIYVKDLYIKKSDISIIGRNHDTIRFEKNGITFIKFFAKDIIAKLDELDGDLRVEVVGKANLNSWMGRVTPQLMMEDCEIKKSSLADF